jgi:hypothetical protein
LQLNQFPVAMSPFVSGWVRKFRKFHKWPGIVISLFVLFFALSGILLNHRNAISSIDLSRKWMPPGYQYNNWNLAALRASLHIGKDSVLFYGNTGIWLQSGFSGNFSDFNQGFPDGIDHRKIYSVVQYGDRLIAGTHFGLYLNTLNPAKWVKMIVPEGEERISDLTVKGDTLFILTRDHLFGTTDLLNLDLFDLPPPAGFERKAGLFLTLWELHSGELFGFAGKLFVDLLGIVLVFLAISGLLHFLFPKMISYLKKQKSDYAKALSLKHLNLKWHNMIGYLFVLFLVVNTTAGIFLRPPLLIPIASARVGILPFTHLDQDNPWHDKLRRIVWDHNLNYYLIYTSDGFYLADKKFAHPLLHLPNQPLVSIMGCNVLDHLDSGHYLVGSFSGLFVWNPKSGMLTNYFTGLPAVTPDGIGRPVGANMVAGFARDAKGREFWFDYNRGAIATDGDTPFPSMTKDILEKSPISLWNAALEVHTGRIFEHLIGPFYLLYVPIIGLTLLVVLISGFLVWWLGYRKRIKAKG